MSSVGAPGTGDPKPSIFLSYASADRAAARAVRDALQAQGVDVWYDESELGGGDAWDQKIRKQIRECDYFMPLISAQTEARHEGYFRREWRLAVERSQDMADDHLFLLPIVIDATDQAAARVPEKFHSVQWLRVPDGRSTPALEALGRRVAAGLGVDPDPSRKAPVAPRGRGGTATAPRIREFPREEPGQRLRFWVHVAGWALQLGWSAFRRLPRWVQWFGYGWIIVFLVSHGSGSSRDDPVDPAPAKAAKLKAIAKEYQGSSDPADIAKLGARIAREFANAKAEAAGDKSPLLAIPFSAPSGDGPAARLADSTFAMAYGRVSIANHGKVGLNQEPLLQSELGAALERGRANHSSYVLWGGVAGAAGAETLTVTYSNVADGAVVWSKSYPVIGSDPAQVATEVAEKVPDLDDT